MKPGASAEAFLGYAVLESAINTFVDGERHRIFESDTDLAYPPDLTRFLNFLGATVHVGIAWWPPPRSSKPTCPTSTRTGWSCPPKRAPLTTRRGRDG